MERVFEGSKDMLATRVIAPLLLPCEEPSPVEEDFHITDLRFMLEGEMAAEALKTRFLWAIANGYTLVVDAGLKMGLKISSLNLTEAAQKGDFALYQQLLNLPFSSTSPVSFPHDALAACEAGHSDFVSDCSLA